MKAALSAVISPPYSQRLTVAIIRVVVYVQSVYGGPLRVTLGSQLAPAHLMAIELEVNQSRAGGLALASWWQIDGARFPWEERIWSPDDLADLYERFHHQVHGYDPRGLDPREGITRLRPR